MRICLKNGTKGTLQWRAKIKEKLVSYTIHHSHWNWASHFWDVSCDWQRQRLTHTPPCYACSQCELKQCWLSVCVCVCDCVCWRERQMGYREKKASRDRKISQSTKENIHWQQYICFKFYGLGNPNPFFLVWCAQTGHVVFDKTNICKKMTRYKSSIASALASVHSANHFSKLI